MSILEVSPSAVLETLLQEVFFAGGLRVRSRERVSLVALEAANPPYPINPLPESNNREPFRRGLKFDLNACGAFAEWRSHFVLSNANTILKIAESSYSYSAAKVVRKIRNLLYDSKNTNEWLKTMEYPKSFDFNYRICKLSSELHHSFLPDFSFPICFYPLFFLNICKNKKNETKTLESFSNTTTTTGLSRVLYYITQQTSAASNYLSLDREEEVPNIVEGIQTSKPNDSQTVD